MSEVAEVDVVEGAEDLLPPITPPGEPGAEDQPEENPEDQPEEPADDDITEPLTPFHSSHHAAERYSPKSQTAKGPQFDGVMDAILGDKSSH